MGDGASLSLIEFLQSNPGLFADASAVSAGEEEEEGGGGDERSEQEIYLCKNNFEI